MDIRVLDTQVFPVLTVTILSLKTKSHNLFGKALMFLSVPPLVVPLSIL